MTSAKPILVAGEINVDWVFGGLAAMPAPDAEVLAESFRQVPGSSSMICAMGMARLGDAVSFVGCAGADARGAFCIDAMRSAGIDVAAVRSDAALETGITVSLSTLEDRALVTLPGSIGALTVDAVDDGLLAGARHLHVSSLYLQRGLRPQLAEWFARARAAGLTTSLDPGFDPAQRWDDGIDWSVLLQQVDVFLPNRREACAITHCEDAETALRALANGTTRIVIKCAGDGALSLDDDGMPLRESTRPSTGACDSTGAGDSFDAGFLHAWLAGLSVRDCLRWGNACGSLSMRGIGGTTCQPDVTEVETWLQAPT
ncbi:MAG TPA: sugar kinase [Rhodanobacteraceae bacterium]